LLNAVRHLAFIPVRAGLGATPADWRWSSVRAHLRGRNDALVKTRPVLSLAPNFAELLRMSPSEEAELARFASLGANGRPLGDEAFLARIERQIGRGLRKRKPGPKPKGKGIHLGDKLEGSADNC